ncbi:hypothetical protein WP50_28225 [Lactiplantibacillus plantarum]|nr:hypothetical protein WP50_28225 [Lactiplantibacillus plantarum]
MIIPTDPDFIGDLVPSLAMKSRCVRDNAIEVKDKPLDCWNLMIVSTVQPYSIIVLFNSTPLLIMYYEVLIDP